MIGRGALRSNYTLAQIRYEEECCRICSPRQTDSPCFVLFNSCCKLSDRLCRLRSDQGWFRSSTDPNTQETAKKFLELIVGPGQMKVFLRRSWVCDFLVQEWRKIFGAGEV